MTTENTKHVSNRTKWNKGEWDNEPEDRLEWRDTATGLPCLMVRNMSGAWCGYVGVPPKHEAHGKSYDVSGSDIDVHGGLTYSGACSGHICHVPQPGEEENVWWLGFDCNHSRDIAPDSRSYRFENEGCSYKNIAYVKDEVTKLAQQLAATAATS